MIDQLICRATNWEQKVWGRTVCLHHSPASSVHVCEVEQGGFSSDHWHEAKYNLLFCVSGKVRICVLDSGEWTLIDLNPNCGITIEPHRVHRFEVLESGLMVETYWPSRGGVVRLEDIQRLNTGGKRGPAGILGTHG